MAICDEAIGSETDFWSDLSLFFMKNKSGLSVVCERISTALLQVVSKPCLCQDIYLISIPGHAKLQHIGGDPEVGSNLPQN